MTVDLLELFFGTWHHICFTEVPNILKLPILKKFGFVSVNVDMLISSFIL